MKRTHKNRERHDRKVFNRLFANGKADLRVKKEKNKFFLVALSPDRTRIYPRAFSFMREAVAFGEETFNVKAKRVTAATLKKLKNAA